MVNQLNTKQFIDGFRFMSSSLSNLVDNLSGRLHTNNCTDCQSYHDFMSIKNNQLIFRCFECKKNQKKDSIDLIERVANIYMYPVMKTYNKFILILRKGVFAL